MISSLPAIAKAVQLIAAHDLRPVELVEYCLRKIDDHDDRIRAWVSVDAEGARREAERLGDLARAGEILGPLHGIPLGIKDIVDVAGWPTQAGSPLRANHVADSDAELVARLRDAGAIILGKTVTTEFACFDPPVTRNPINIARSPGGSSSGSAAAVAMEMCCAAIGTQTGGSIVRPASYCGIAGLKPTLGLVPMAGVVPISNRLDHAGPMARSVTDLLSVFLSLLDASQFAAICAERWLAAAPGWNPSKMAQRDRLTGFLSYNFGPEWQSARLYAIDDFFMENASDDVRAVTRSALARVQDAWSAERPLELPSTFSQVREHHLRMMSVDAAFHHRAQYEEHRDEYGPRVSELIEQGLAEMAVDYAAAIDHRERFRQDITAIFDNGAIAVMPSTTTTAPSLETTGDPALNAPWSYSGFPSITIPCGVAQDGLPCGLQFVGPPYSELRLLKAAFWCERILNNPG